ncbi:MAG: RagB/SusD family nutrient uptake outer membrane protein [Bacteroidales bacterium]|nr:RagB/SusD family nutrient uptake outer membrane protein [Bacteroidales bacterium]
MKLNKISLFILACVIPASCVDLNYTEQNTRDEAWTYEYFAEGIKNMVFDVYAQVYNDEFESNSAYFLASATDEAQYALETGAVCNYTNGGWSAANPYSRTWTKCYTGIADVCMYLEKIYQADLTEWQYNSGYSTWQQQMELFPYELRFLRAYFYFELLRAYGDVPLVISTLTNAEANSISRAPASEIVDFIVNELDAIAPYLPISYLTEPGAEVGRATRIAAFALKARTLLYAASPLFNDPTSSSYDATKWAKAAEACKVILDNASTWGLSLSAYGSLWGHDAFFNPEIIFGIGRGESNSFEMANYPVGVENGSSGNCPTQSFVDQYEYKNNGQTFGQRNPGVIDLSTNPYDGLDPRFALTVVKNGDEWPTNGAQKKAIETYIGGYNASPKYGATPTGYYLRKYVDGSCVTTADNQTRRRHTWIIFRLAEVYLNYAEAVFHATGSANDATYGLTANQAINVLRDREDIQMPWFNEEGDAWLARYERERLVELAFENHRFWDVRRWKKGEQYFKTIQVASISNALQLTRVPVTRQWDDKYNFYPIPQSELKKNPNLKQNPGWDNVSAPAGE